MITEAEADMQAAAAVLAIVLTMGKDQLPESIQGYDALAVLAALKPIEQWLRRRALGEGTWRRRGSDPMLGSKDEDEIRRRARLVREAREAARDRRQKNPTVAEYDEILGDECGKGSRSRKDDERQRKGGS